MNDDTLLDLRSLVLMAFAAGIGVLAGYADGISAGLIAGLGAIAILQVLVSRR